MDDTISMFPEKSLIWMAYRFKMKMSGGLILWLNEIFASLK
jgi:hypothetical protein